MRRSVAQGRRVKHVEHVEYVECRDCPKLIGYPCKQSLRRPAIELRFAQYPGLSPTLLPQNNSRVFPMASPIQPTPVGVPAVRPLATPVHYINFIAGVQEGTVQRLLNAVVGEIQKGAKTIYLLLSTPGGSVREGMALYNILRGLPCEIVTHNIANVDSIGNVVFLAGGKRYAAPNATFMFHGVGFDINQGTRLEQKSAKEVMDGIAAETKRMAQVIESRAGFTDNAEIEQLFLEASTKDAAYAKGHGIIHDIRDVQISPGSPFLPLVF
jgi:ATP-dependent Clp protease, protease subunit